MPVHDVHTLADVHVRHGDVHRTHFPALGK